MNINGFSISESNEKLGPIGSFSTAPIVTCPAGVPCANKCYARRPYDRWPAVFNAYNANTEKILHKKDFKGLEKAVSVWCMLAPLPLFRWGVSGDVTSVHHWAALCRIAKAHPDFSFQIFTKAFDSLEKFCRKFGYRKAIPPNLHIRLSPWCGLWEPSEYLTARFGVAIFCPKEDENKKWPKGMHHCKKGMYCARCQYCYKAENDLKPLVMHEH